MIELPAERMAAVMGADLHARGPGGHPEKAVIDSREISGGEIFFGLTGGADDGGRFAKVALEAGAWGVVVEPSRAAELDGLDGWVFTSEDPLRSLQMLARAWRRELGATVIGITGSVGKTSVKDITAAILPGEVHASAENFNTEIGLPLTILEAPAGTGILVLEMAMRGSGQIAELAAIAEPDVGVITNVGPVHVELLGSIEAVAAAKAELIGGLKPDGILIVPVESGHLEPHLDLHPGLVRFGPGGDVRSLSSQVSPTHTMARISTSFGTEEFVFPFTESHNLHNALAAVAVGISAGARPSELSARAGRVSFSKLRGEHHDLGAEGLLINDCYNANPLSMRAALDYLSSLDRPQKVAVLGQMAELGPDALRFHEEIGDYAREAGIDTIVSVGREADGYGAEVRVDTPAEAADWIRENLEPRGAVLVKGSRSAGLEAVQESLEAAEMTHGPVN